MPMHPVTSTLMYRGICTIPDILSYSAPVNLPEDEVEEIREAFKVFDRDGNGFISKQELGMAMRSLGYMPNEVELEVIIQRLDMDAGDGQVDFEEFITLLGPKLTAAGMPDKFNGTDFDSVFWKCDMQKLTVEELKRLLYDTFCDHLSMKDIENIIMTEENHIENPEDCQVDIDNCSYRNNNQIAFRHQMTVDPVGLQILYLSSFYLSFCSSPTQQVKQTCVRKSLICAFAIAFIISVMLIAANQVLRSGMK
uniref:Calcium binding protein 7 n=1 Tax=Poecilia formosa TaxID=48698 RepID=A0A096M4M8_POEFO